MLLAPVLAAFVPWTYDVTVAPKARELTVTAGFPAPPGKPLVLKKGAASFVRKVEQKTAKGFKPLKGHEEWVLGPCPKSGCVVRYKFALADAAAKLANFDMIAEMDGVIVSDPAAWLLHPAAADPDQPARLVIGALPKGVAFASGIFPSPALDSAKQGVYEWTAAWFESLPMTIFGAARLHRLEPKGATVDLAVVPAPYAVTDAQIVAWANRATAALVAYYGRYPVPHALILVRPPSAGSGGMSFGEGGAASIVPLSFKATDEKLRSDWVMTHEMVHLALPNVEHRHHWLEEGLATYVEPIARLRSHELSPAKVFKDMVDGMPNGLPAAGDHGLDHTDSWGSTYWGGALFCLLADVELRERSGGKLGLEDAMRGVLAAGGSIAERWDINDLFKVADKATGLPVLTELYAKMKDAAYPVDLPALWKKLGVAVGPSGAVIFDDKAPAAYVRRGIVDGGAAPP